jgi:hypothetical protein
MFWLISYVIRGAICIFHNLYVSIASRAGFMLSLNVARPWVFNTASYFSVCIPILFEAFQRVLEMVQIQILRKMCVKRTFLPSRFPPALQTRPIITTFLVRQAFSPNGWQHQVYIRRGKIRKPLLDLVKREKGDDSPQVLEQQ